MLTAILHTGQTYTKFAANLRNASRNSTKREIVAAELTRIRGLFMESGSLSNSETRDILLTLTHIAMLGHELGQTGAFEALGALTSSCTLTRIWAHQVIACLFSHNNDVINFIRPCLQDSLRSIEANEVAAALNTAACMPLPNDPQPMLPSIEQLANPSNDASPHVRKRALVALCKYVSVYPDLFPAQVWAPRLAQSLKAETNGNCLITLCSFLECSLRSHKTIAGWEIIFPYAMRKLASLRHSPIGTVTLYHGVPNPWVQIRLMKLLRLFPMPTQISLLQELEQILIAPFTKSGKAGATSNAKIKCATTHAEQAILLESVSLIAHFNAGLSIEGQQVAVAIMASLMSTPSPISRYVAVSGMTLMATLPATKGIIAEYRDTIAQTLHQGDATIIEETCDLLLALANEDNWAVVLDDISKVLRRKDICTPVKYDIAFRAAVIAKRLAPSSSQLTSVIFKLVSASASTSLWQEMIVLLTEGKNLEKKESLQRTAAAEALRVLRNHPRPETTRMFCLYLLGEFGYLLVSDETCKNADLIDLAAEAVDEESPRVATVALTAVAKLTNAACVHSDTKKGLAVLKAASLVEDLEMQTRASELFLTLKQRVNFADTILSVMPPYGIDDSSDMASNSPAAVPPGKRSPSDEEDSASDSEDASKSTSSSSASSSNASSTIAASSFEETKSWKDSSIAKNDLKALWHFACLSDQGLICEHEELKITFARRVKASMAKITIFVQNVSSGALRLTWSQEPGDGCLQVEEAHQKAMPIGLAYGEIARMDLRVVHRSLALTPCFVRMSVEDGSEFNVPVPLSALSFMHPIKSSLQAVREQWMKMTEVESAVTSGVAKQQMRDERAVENWMEKGLHMQVFRVQKTAAGTVLLGTGMCETSSSRIGVILKTELKGEKCQVSVRSSKSPGDFAMMLSVYLLAAYRQAM